MSRFLLLAALLLFSLGAPLAPALAADEFDPAVLDKMAEEAHQVPLTEDMINRFVASYPEMREIGAKFPAAQTPDEPSGKSDSDKGDSDKSDLDALPPEKREAMTAVATKHGFKDLQEWSDVAQSVVMSYAYLREGKGLDELDKMMNQLVAQAENDTKLTEEQKQKTIAQVRELGAKLAKLQPLPQNYKLVEKMIGKVAPVMKVQ
ncbi:MAG: hypothetical protein MUO37_02340 [Methyloceanibacter sp.]|nr:hypothetical protein [Methyloceanibacter sp.]